MWDTILKLNQTLRLLLQNPHVVEQISHDPDELLVTYAQQQKHIQHLRDQLKTILRNALKD